MSYYLIAVRVLFEMLSLANLIGVFEMKTTYYRHYDYSARREALREFVYSTLSVLIWALIGALFALAI